MTAVVYGNFLKHLWKGDVDTDTDTFKVCVLGSGYSPNKDSHEFRSSLSSEVSGTGYTAGGVALTNIAVSLDTTNDRAKLTADPAYFGSAVTFTSGTQLVVYVSKGSAGSDILLSFHTFSAPASPSGVPFQYNWGADGVGYISYPG